MKVTLFSFILLPALAVESVLGAAHPIERQIRKQFPSIALDSRSSFDKVQESVAGKFVSGMRPRETTEIQVFYPASYDEPFVAELGEQRVVLRALGAHFTSAVASEYKCRRTVRPGSRHVHADREHDLSALLAHGYPAS